MTRIISGTSEMHSLAADVAGKLQGGDILLLYGELGSGKTTFVQGLAKALGVKEPVTSPTFVIASEYSVATSPQPSPHLRRGGLPLHTLVHVDLYRLTAETAASDPSVRDVLSRAADPGRLTVVEWADRLGEAVPPSAQKLRFEHGKGHNERVLTFS